MRITLKDDTIYDFEDKYINKVTVKSNNLWIDLKDGDILNFNNNSVKHVTFPRKKKQE